MTIDDCKYKTVADQLRDRKATRHAGFNRSVMLHWFIVIRDVTLVFSLR